MELTYNLAIPLLGIYPKKLRAWSQKDIAHPYSQPAYSLQPRGESNTTVHQLMNRQTKCGIYKEILFSLKKVGKPVTCYMNEPSGHAMSNEEVTKRLHNSTFMRYLK